MPGDPFLDSDLPLTPGHAAVALILLPEQKYLLQLRDPLPHIFHPGHWGCFGGAIEPGETPEAALVRELKEELDLDVAPQQLNYFTRFTFDFDFAGIGTVGRSYYSLQLQNLDGLTLQEGAEMRGFTAQEALQSLRLTPHDAFALWMHMAQTRFQPPPACA